jgi:predicted nucleotidyltransferase
MSLNTSLENIEKAINEVAVELGASKAILFGSFAKGIDTSKSDVDVVFIKDTTIRFLDRLDRPLMLLYEKIKGRAIDVLVYTPDEFNRMLKDENRFIMQIHNQGKVVYES